MTEKRNITKEDIFLEARLRAEGARIEVKEASDAKSAFRAFVMDGCDLVTIALPNPRSRLEIVVNGDDVTISEGDEVLGTGTLEERYSWRDKLMSDGTTVDSAISASPTITNISMNHRCYNYDTGKGCKFCGLFYGSKTVKPDAGRKLTDRFVEAAVIAVQSGWRGTILLTGGVLPPSRHTHMTDNVERIMAQFRESLDEETLAELHMAIESFPPDDLSVMLKWKDLGLNSTEFDIQIMDPAYFKAICPGRGEQDRWKEAQEASVEIFGRGRGSVTAVVMGIEPMDGLVEGIEERISKGVYTKTLLFFPSPGSPYAGFRPPTAEWIVEAGEKIVDVYLRYSDTLDVDLITDTRPGYTRMGQSFVISTVDDEMIRRLQEMGKLPPGLPKQGFC